MMKSLLVVLVSLSSLAFAGCVASLFESEEPSYMDSPTSMPAPQLVDPSRATSPETAKALYEVAEDEIGLCREVLEKLGAQDSSVSTSRCEAVYKGQGPVHRSIQDWQAPLLIDDPAPTEEQASLEYMMLATFRARYECESALLAKLGAKQERFTGKDTAYLLNEAEYDLNADELPIGRIFASRYHTTHEDTGERNAWTVGCYFDFDQWKITSLSVVRVLDQ